MKKVFTATLAILLTLAFFTACGKQDKKTADAPAADVESFTTIGEALALEGIESEHKSCSETSFVYAFKLGDDYWRLIADLSEEESAALWDLDITDENYDAKYLELTSQLKITKCEKLNDQMLTDEEMKALEGQTGEKLLEDGWTSGMGYNLDEMEFYLSYGPFEYTVVFEAKEKLENTDDFDELEAIRDLMIKSVACTGLSDAATDLPEANAE